ncbi:MAG TPA: hypothetical protein ENH29_09730 [Bacteroidetes bacterium]|nr:hypothetical protein [Bacteroidota bacterium]
MNMYRRRQFAYLSAVFLILGTVGVIGFFPVNFESRYTCIYHRFFCDGMQNPTLDVADGNRPGGLCYNSEVPHNDLLKRYLIPFGFLWWSSIGLLVAGIYLAKVNIPANFGQRNAEN